MALVISMETNFLVENYIVTLIHFNSCTIKTVIGFKRNLLDPQVFLSHYVLVCISELHSN
ncbi:MAG: hypothetical protein CM15mP44_5500 [Candidatus Neomarinimicrobiota bacterium]|nr:MAG: hypothetical protein CM15mP44_5500 [Candidatus Neomarinimicrobiota bacterium]